MSAHEHWQMDASAPELYERYLVPAITSVWANDLLDRISLSREESVLDIACGTGVVARLAQQRGHAGRLVGIDVNMTMLAVARAKSTAVEWIEGSALDLPFDANSFDVVQLGLQFFPDRPMALREMVRVLKPGGRHRSRADVVPTMGAKAHSITTVPVVCGACGMTSTVSTASAPAR